jgi:putative transposase
MDFVANQLFNGLKFRSLTVFENHSPKCLGRTVRRFFNHLQTKEGGAPQIIQVDNGPEFESKSLDKWAYDSNTLVNFSIPGKPTDSPFIESFNRRFRDACLCTIWLLSLHDAEEKIESW